jgi:hypothetical protein
MGSGKSVKDVETATQHSLKGRERKKKKERQ